MEVALVSLTFDDGLRCQFERAVPILNERNLPSTFFLVANTEQIHTDGFPHPDWHKRSWSAEDISCLKHVLDNGHEIGADSLTHRRPELDQNPKLEAEGSKRWIESRLGTLVTSYCYPFCYVTGPIKAAVIDAGYKQARGGANGSFLCSSKTDFFNLDCRLISRDEVVGTWLRPGCWHILMYHGIGTIDDGWQPIPVSEFTRQMGELQRLRDRGAVEVVTFRDGSDRLRQTG